MRLTHEGMNKQEFLYHIYNDLGYTDLYLCISTKNLLGELVWLPWQKYSELMELAPDEYVPNIKKNMTRDNFIAHASHRTILDIELLFDVDDASYMKSVSSMYGMEDFYKYESIFSKSKHILTWLRENNHDVTICFTGNKSYHLSLLIPALRDMPRWKRVQFKRDVLTAWDCDPMCSGDKHPIALENAIHYRSGRPKLEVVI